MMQLRLQITALALAALLLLSATISSAASYNYDFTAADHSSSDFSLVGDAFWVNDGGVAPPTRLRLTSNAGGQEGSAWLNTNTVDASQAWTADILLQMSYEANGGADGMAFHIHESGTGVNTNFIGSSLSTSALSVSIDTFDNGGQGNFGLQIYRGGIAVSGIANLSVLGTPAPDIYQLLLAYDGASTLALNVINTANSNQTGIINVGPLDLSDMDNATFGWSANTGGATQNQDILSFSGEFAASAPVPEPGTGLLLGVGLFGLGVCRNRRV
jgi:hypothetical protein